MSKPKIIDWHHPEAMYMDAFLDGVKMQYVQAVCLDEGWMEVISVCTDINTERKSVDVDEFGQAICRRLHGKVEIRYKDSKVA